MYYYGSNTGVVFFLSMRWDYFLVLGLNFFFNLLLILVE